jgi:hypothetical protein
VNTIERGAAVASVLVLVFGAGAAWNSLSGRIDKVDEKISAVQKSLGSTPCTAILTRQLAAIDKDRPDVRNALEGLSNQYGCAPATDYATTEMNASADMTTDAATMNAVTETSTAQTNSLRAQLNAVDAQLNSRKR